MKNYYKYIKATKIFSCLASVIAITIIAGCKKVIDIGPPKTLVNAANVYSTNGTAEAVVAGLFSTMSGSGQMFSGTSSFSVQEGLAADELKYYSTTAGGNTFFYTNTLNAQSPYYWPEIYSEVFTCNSAVIGLTSPAASSLTPAIQQQLLGDVKFVRAYDYFNAVNLFGDVPLVLGTDPAVNNMVGRTAAADVLAQVVKDLTDAQALLPDNQYLTLVAKTTTDRILPNKQTATALLARVYLYNKDWKNAETQATSVISASSYLLEPVLTNVFLKASRETIWQIQSTSTSFANPDANAFVMVAAPNGLSNNYGISDGLKNAFETGDKRFDNWVGKLTSGATTYYFPYKYKQNGAPNGTYNEFPIMFRLAEQYLIRAEARAQQNNISGAQSDLNAVRTRAGLANTTAATQVDLLTAIYNERRIELFSEFGHRWFDLKRTGRLDAVMTTAAPVKGGTWSAYKALIPIPATELILNANMKQNPGY